VIRLLERRDLERSGTCTITTRPCYVSPTSGRCRRHNRRHGSNRFRAHTRARRYVGGAAPDDALVGVFRLDRLDPWNRNAYVGADVCRPCAARATPRNGFAYFLRHLSTTAACTGSRSSR